MNLVTIFPNNTFLTQFLCQAICTQRTPKGLEGNRRLYEHGIYIRYCQESNPQPVPSKARADPTRPQWRNTSSYYPSAGPPEFRAKNEEFRVRVWGIPRHSPAGHKLRITHAHRIYSCCLQVGSNSQSHFPNRNKKAYVGIWNGRGAGIFASILIYF